MKRKIGRLCMVLGAVLILCAAGLLGYNRWDAARAEKASQEVLGELEQTMQRPLRSTSRKTRLQPRSRCWTRRRR